MHHKRLSKKGVRKHKGNAKIKRQRQKYEHLELAYSNLISSGASLIIICEITVEKYKKLFKTFIYNIVLNEFGVNR